MPPQIQRLILLTCALVAAYWAAREVLTPKSFGEYGWYRGEALRELAALPATYAGKAACVECHEETGTQLAKSKHQAVACEACHGPNAAHAETFTTEPTKITNPRFCLRCHQANPSRPAKFPQVEVAEHFGDQVCGECHLPHLPTESPTK